MLKNVPQEVAAVGVAVLFIAFLVAMFLAFLTVGH